MGAGCYAEEGATGSVLDGHKFTRGSASIKQHFLQISKTELPVKDIDTVQGYIRHYLKSTPLDSELVIPREVMDLILFFYALRGSVSDKVSSSALEISSDYHIVDLVYTEKSGGGIDVKCQVTGPAAISVNSQSVNELFIGALAGFVHALPQHSKQQIWAHAVKVKQHDGVRNVLDATNGLNHVEQLLFDMVMVYLKV